MPVPRRSYLVAATQRSGSTLLCRALTDTGVAGRPEEYFLAGSADAFLDRAETLHALFPDLHVIRLTRRDRVSQAVSWARAAQDGVWVVSETEPAATAGEPAYRYDFIAGLEGLLIEGEHGWPELCAELGVTPLDIVYEDLVDPSTYAQTIRAALHHLGVDTDEIAIPEPRTHRQADGTNRDWVERYRADRARSDPRGGGSAGS